MSNWLVDTIGFLAGACTTLAVLPQIRRAWKTHQVNDISLPFSIVLLTGVSLWTVYGIIKNDWPIIIANGVSVILNASLLYLLLRYGKGKKH